MTLTSEEIKTMTELLEYPNPVGLRQSEARWRDLARHLLSEVKRLEAEIDCMVEDAAGEDI